MANSVFCPGTKIAWLGAKSNLSAGIAFTALIISLSITLTCASSAAAGVAIVPAAGPLAVPPVCAAAISEPMPNTQHTAIYRNCIEILQIMFFRKSS